MSGDGFLGAADAPLEDDGPAQVVMTVGQVDGQRVRRAADVIDEARVTMRMRGPGTASLTLEDDGLNLVVEGTTTRSQLTILTPGLVLDDVEVNGGIRAIRAPNVDVEGDIEIADTAGFLQFGDLLGDEQNVITIGEGGARDAVLLRFRDVANATFDSETDVRAFVVDSWTDPGPAPDSLTAPRVRRIRNGGAWQASVNLAADDGGISLIDMNVGSLFDSRITAPGLVGRIVVRGDGSAAPSFVNSVVSAANGVRALRLQHVAFDNGGIPLGTLGPSVSSLSYRDDNGRLVRRRGIDRTVEEVRMGDFHTNVEAEPGPFLPDFDRAGFNDSLDVDNPYFPLVVGAQRVYEGTFIDDDGEEATESFTLEVLEATITIDDVEARIVKDSAFEDDLLVEETFDYYAQDDRGNVWYLGEDVTNYRYDDDDNLIGTDHDSAWQTGVNDALPGIIMLARPRVGDNYYQEFAAEDDALDQAVVTGVIAEVQTPVGEFVDVLATLEFSEVEPDKFGTKLYAPDLGLALEEEGVDADGSGEPELTVELIRLGDEVVLKDAKLNIEHNATDLDTGFQGFIDSEGWQQLDMTGEDGGDLLTFTGQGELGDLGLTELFFETVEPENDEVSIADMLATLPAGAYTIEGPAIEDGASAGWTSGTALLTHAIPAGPQLLTPAEDAALNAAEDLVVSWAPVTETITGDPVTIIAYQLIIENDQEPHPHMIGKQGLSAYVPAAVTSITIPAGLLETDTDYAWEVLAIEESGNQTLASSAFSTGAGAGEADQAADDEDPPNLKAAMLNIEHNATDLDTGFQGFIDSEGWQRLDVTGPGGELVLTLEGHEALGELGLTELFFETVEPENADVPIEEMLAILPAGNYTIAGPSMQNGESGGPTSGTAWLTHVIPSGPELLTPAEGSTVVVEGLVMSWNPVTETIDGGPVDIIAYQLIIEKDQAPHPNMIGKLGLSMYLPATTTSVVVPPEILDPGTAYEWEVLAIEESGNQTLSSGAFETEAP